MLSPVYLENLRKLRQHSGLSPLTISRIADIARDRYNILEARSRVRAEPWFDEALTLSRILNLPGIIPLLSDDLTPPAPDADLTYDLTLWDTGARLPLSSAYRLAFRFGVPDPAALDVPPLMREIWSVVEQGERTGATGRCAWCGNVLSRRASGVSVGHDRACMAHNLLGDRRTPAGKPVTIAARPSEPGRGNLGRMAPGLRRFRVKRRFTQETAARRMGLTPNYYARIERCEVPLRVVLAEQLAILFDTSVGEIYAPDPDTPPMARVAQALAQA